MERDKGMAETVAPMMPSAAEIAAVQVADRGRSGGVSVRIRPDPVTGAFRVIECGAARTPRASPRAYVLGPFDRCAIMFVGGRSDWALYQTPARWTRCGTRCTRMVGSILLDARALGAAGAAGTGEHVASSSSCGQRRSLSQASGCRVHVLQ